MSETVAANGQTICHKNASGFVRSTLPDVCKAPKIPVPFVNVAFATDLAKGTKTIKSHSGAMCGIKGSEFSTSIGDEGGVGKGVKSGTQLDKATWLSWSPNVFAEGKPMTRLSDRMLMNNGNTVSAAGYFTGVVTGSNQGTLDYLCVLGCAAYETGTNQAGVEAALRTQLAAQPQPTLSGLFPEVTFDPSGTMYTNSQGVPQTVRFVRGSILDVTTVVNGRPVEFIEMKFPGDRMRGNQRERYQDVAAANNAQLQEMWIPQDCNGCEGTRQLESEGLGFWDYVLGGLIVAGILAAGACIYFSGGICAIPLAGGGLAAA